MVNLYISIHHTTQLCNIYIGHCFESEAFCRCFLGCFGGKFEVFTMHLEVFQRCYGGVSRIFQRHFGGVYEALGKNFGGILEAFWRHFRFLWASKSFYGLPWTSMDINGLPWTSLDFHGLILDAIAFLD